MSDAANLYGLLGFTKGKLEASAAGISISESDSGLSYGIGLESDISGGVCISGEYMFYLSESTYDYAAFNIGLGKHF